jgi:hypothetical protein
VFKNIPKKSLPSNVVNVNAKLKHGKRSVIIADVAHGVASFNEFIEADYSSEPLYNRKPGRGSKGKASGKTGKRIAQ